LDTASRAALAGAPTAASPDPVGNHGHRVTSLIAVHTDVLDDIVRTMLEDTPTGKLIFDTLVSMGENRWSQLREGQLTAPDLGDTWAALNPLVLVSRWGSSVNTLLQRGQLHTPPPDPSPEHG
jgi:hypothetical protein